MIYIRNTMVMTAKSADYLGNAGIVDSRFNPLFLSLPENGLQERLEKLQGDIEALKSKLAVSRM